MTISVDIADRQYDYTDEEKAAHAIAGFQDKFDLSDDEIMALWLQDNTPLRVELERAIFDAVDTNGSVKRARDTIPNGISLFIESAIA